MAIRLLLTLAAAGLLAGCMPRPEAFETVPVEVETASGVVTCQLYTKEMVLWDRSIDRPATMGVEEADRICRAEGIKDRDS